MRAGRHTVTQQERLKSRGTSTSPNQGQCHGLRLSSPIFSTFAYNRNTYARLKSDRNQYLHFSYASLVDALYSFVILTHIQDCLPDANPIYCKACFSLSTMSTPLARRYVPPSTPASGDIKYAGCLENGMYSNKYPNLNCSYFDLPLRHPPPPPLLFFTYSSPSENATPRPTDNRWNRAMPHDSLSTSSPNDSISRRSMNGFPHVSTYGVDPPRPPQEGFE